MHFDAAAIEVILVAADLEGLIAMGAPTDEYSSEAAKLTRRLDAEANTLHDVLPLLCEVFAGSFGFASQFDHTCPRFRYAIAPLEMPHWEAVAEEIWRSRK